MKKIIATLTLASAVMVASGQTTEDALRISQDKPSGTARSMALSGAMGALGGDFTSIGINPAGIAVYRSSEFTFTPSLQYTKTESDYFGIISSDDKFSLPFQQIGFVGTYRPIHEVSSGLISTHFGIGYSRNNSFSRRSFIQGNGIQSSLLDMFVDQANAGNWDPLYNRLAQNANLIEKNPYFDEVSALFPGRHVSEYMTNYDFNFQNIDDEFGQPRYEYAIPQWGPRNGINQTRMLNERGSSNEFNLTFGANFSHKFYLGGSIGIPVFHHERSIQHYEEIRGEQFNYRDYPETFEGYYESRYYENSIDGEGWFGLNNFTFDEKISTSGVGLNVKAGFIYKPTNSFRVGASIHSPTFYSIETEYTTHINADQFAIDFIVNDNTQKEELWLTNVELYKERGFDEVSYNFRTPLKAIGSLAYLFGSHGLISMDYEFTDYTSMQFKSKSNHIIDMQDALERNKLINNTFRATHNLRFGAEYRPTELFSLRAGYGVFQSPYKEGHFKNKDKHQTYSAGFGFRMDNMFVDFGYMLRQEKETYSLYYASHLNDEDQLPAQLKTNRHHFGVTLGWRF